MSNYFEGRWRPTELQAGRFCEVVYSIIAGRASNDYPAQAQKPSNFIEACKKLENSQGLERGLRILASRMLPTLYEIRNNRDVGHVNGDVDPNFMDSSYTVAASSWLMGELIRVFHSLSTQDAQQAVIKITELKTPAVWVDSDVRRVLDTKLSLRSQCLLLTASAGESVTIDKLLGWTEAKNKAHFKKLIQVMHKERLIEAADPNISIRLLPAGAIIVRNLISE